MARLHTHYKGKSGSKKPLSKTPPSWVQHKPEEVEFLVQKLAKQGKNTAEIGLILRDTYGIPDAKVITGKKMSQILKEQKLAPEIPEDITNLVKRAITARKHFENNKKDMVTKRGIQLIESKIRRLAKYYKKTGQLPKDWKYDPAKARLLAG